MPRHASASKKRKADAGPANNSAMKKAKTKSTAVAESETGVPGPQTQGIMPRAAERLKALVPEKSSAEAPRSVQSNVELAQQALQQVGPAKSDPAEDPKQAQRYTSTATADIRVDPQLSDSPHPVITPTDGAEPPTQNLIQPSIPPIEDDDFHHLATSPLSELNSLNDLKWESDFGHPIPCSSPTFQQQPPASSLVSPPASHTDAERTPPAPSNMQTITPSATSSSSRHSSRANKTVQRYTPESGSVRRNSSVSAGKMRESGSPVLRSAVKGEGGAAQKKGKSRRESEGVGDADEESMRLIRELQAQDMGLRRRARG